MAFDDLDEGWKRTIDGAKSGKATDRVKVRENGKEVVKEVAKEKGWDYYDKEIQKSVDSFNNYLKSKDYISLDWKIIRAMIWVETSPYKDEWNTKPIQIGNKGDAGIDDVTRGKYRELIIPKEYQAELSNKQSITANPDINIRAGIAYLLYSLATYGTEEVYDTTDSKVYQYKVQKGDSGFWGIMQKLKKSGISTTVKILTDMNPSARIIKPDMIINYRKGSVQDVIKSWRAITTANIQKYYNRPYRDKEGKQHGDPLYSEKLDYCLMVMNKK